MSKHSAKHTRKTLARNIFQDRYGISIFVNGSEKGNRFPIGTPLDELIKTRDELEEKAKTDPKRRRRGTLAIAVPIYLETLPPDITTGIERRRRRSDAARLLGHWLKATTASEDRIVTFGEVPLGAITSVMVRAQLAAWRGKGWSESYCDHHRRELGTLYNTLNGKEGYNPVRSVPKFNPKYTDPRGFDLKVMDLIIDAMPDRGKPPKGSKAEEGTLPMVSFSKIRIRCMRHAGIPPQTLKRVRSQDINFTDAELRTTHRQKGSGAAARTVPLTDAAVDAFRDFHTHRLYGWFSTSSLNQAFKRSAESYRATWKADRPDEPCPIPDDLHAYDLRHCFLSDLYRKTGDKKIVGHLGLHAEDSTATDRYVQAAVDDVARRAIMLVNRTSKPTSKRVGKIGKKPNERRKNRTRDVA